eukprot:2646461-Rhodomonas_salina.2
MDLSSGGFWVGLGGDRISQNLVVPSSPCMFSVSHGLQLSTRLSRSVRPVERTSTPDLVCGDYRGWRKSAWQRTSLSTIRPRNP